MKKNISLVILSLLLLWILSSCGGGDVGGSSGGGGGSSGSGGGSSSSGGGTSGSGGGGVPSPVATKTSLVSVATDNTQGNHDSSAPSISSDGRYVAFGSTANNLVAGDTNGVADIFVHDRDTDADGIFDETGAVSTTRVSISSGGIQGNHDSSAPSISSDGRYVAFGSTANNLVAGDTNGVADIFVHDRDADGNGVFDESGTGATSTTRVSVSSDGIQGNHDSSAPSISSDGRYVAFGSTANNLVAGDTNGVADIFVHDRGTTFTTRVSISSVGIQGNHDSSAPSISSDGRYVAFESTANNLVAGDTNGVADIFVHDRGTTFTTRVSISSVGIQGNNTSSDPSISSDGRYVVFGSAANNLVAGDTNGVADIFVHDRDTDADGIFDETGAVSTTRISVSSGGTQGNHDSSDPSISSDGRHVAFGSAANNLVEGDTNGVADIFVYDLTGSTVVVAVSGNHTSSAPSISQDGRYVAFESEADNLVAGDTNGTVKDIFVIGP